jgi:nitrite reductase/ring-hydroxylating ferredoxin subunit
VEHPPAPDEPTPACGRCELAERREFLRQAAVALAGLAVALGGAPARAAALPLQWGRATGRSGDLLTYPVPGSDGAQIDHANQVILVRYQGKAFAFNLSCPHQNTALHWQSEDGIFQCPKHHSRYLPDGEFISGRATRGLDRLGIREDGTNLVVDTDQYYRQDRDAAAWNAAFVTL